MGLEGSEIMVNGKPARFPLPGKHNLADALAAWAIAREIPVRAESVRKGLESVKPLFGRSEVIRGPVTVFRDCYNANPESMNEAVAFCDSLDWQKGRKMYVIGSMLELGADSEEAHRELGRQLAASTASEVFLYGEETVPAREEAEMAGVGRWFFHTNDMEQLKERLILTVREGDFVLHKGSRGCVLERLDEALSQRTQR
jgi:UDP-N-acetylmuramoyl-tripeptide--D-alanyl-D-alanine ligase